MAAFERPWRPPVLSTDRVAHDHPLRNELVRDASPVRALGENKSLPMGWSYPRRGGEIVFPPTRDEPPPGSRSCHPIHASAAHVLEWRQSLRADVRDRSRQRSPLLFRDRRNGGCVFECPPLAVVADDELRAMARLWQRGHPRVSKAARPALGIRPRRAACRPRVNPPRCLAESWIEPGNHDSTNCAGGRWMNPHHLVRFGARIASSLSVAARRPAGDGVSRRQGDPGRRPTARVDRARTPLLVGSSLRVFPCPLAPTATAFPAPAFEEFPHLPLHPTRTSSAKQARQNGPSRPRKPESRPVIYSESRFDQTPRRERRGLMQITPGHRGGGGKRLIESP